MEPITAAQPLVERVYETLRDAICAGDIAPGERMAEDALARCLDVSRQPIHEALRRLHREGFLCETGRRGLAVAPINVTQVEHVYELRAALESEAARRAAERAVGADRARGEDILLAGRQAVADADIRAMIQADFRFHHYIYEMSGNSVIAAVATTNWHHVRRVASALSRRLLNLAPLWQEHEAILLAVTAGDGDAAAELARRHVEVSIDTMRGFGAAAFNSPTEARIAASCVG